MAIRIAGPAALLASGALVFLALLNLSLMQDPESREIPSAAAVESGRPPGASAPAPDVGGEDGGFSGLPENRLMDGGFAPAGSFSLTIVDRDSNPVSGASVGILDEKRLSGLLEKMPWRECRVIYDTEALVDRHGAKAVSGPGGVVELPAFEWGALVSARSGKSWGMLRLARMPVSLGTLEVMPDRFAAIRVLDSSGGPVEDAEVIIVGRRGGKDFQAWSGRTAGSDATAVARNLDREYRFQRDASYSVHPGFPVAGCKPVAIDPFNSGDKPYTVVLPETGRLAVELVDAAGNPCLKYLPVTAVLAGDSGDDIPEEYRYCAGTVEASGGRALFRHVTPGSRVGLYAYPMFCPFRMHFGEGPRAAGQEALIRIEVEEYAVLKARLLDENGAPAGRLELKCMIELENSDGIGIGTFFDYLSSDADGRLEKTIKPDHFLSREDGEPCGGRISLFTMPDCSVAGAMTELNAVIELPSGLPSGPFDAGDVVLERSPLLVDGKVVDGGGLPVAGALVTIASEGTMQSITRSFRQREAFESDPWQNKKAVSGPDGGFEIYAFPADMGYEERIGAMAWKPGLLESQPVFFSPSAGDIELCLDSPGGGIEGRLLLPANAPGDAVWIRITGLKTAFVEDGGSLPVTPGKSGAFRLLGLPCGNAVVQVGGRDDQLPSYAAGVEIKEGGPVRDPRFDPLNLRGILRRIVVSAADRSGAPLEGAAVRLDGNHSPAGYTDRFGHAAVVTCRSEVEIEAGKPGFRSVSMKTTGSDASFILAPCIQVRLVLECGMPLPDPPLEVACSLKGRTYSGTKVFHPGESGKKAEFELPAPGSYAVGLAVRRIVGNDDGQYAKFEDVEGLYPPAIFVRDSDEAQEFRIEVAPDVLKRVLDRVGGD